MTNSGPIGISRAGFNLLRTGVRAGSNKVDVSIATVEETAGSNSNSVAPGSVISLRRSLAEAAAGRLLAVLGGESPLPSAAVMSKQILWCRWRKLSTAQPEPYPCDARVRRKPKLTR